MLKIEIEKILKDNGIRITQNRIDILKSLSDEDHFHTIAEIVNHTKGMNAKSVYNNIKILINEGIVDTVSFGGISKYAINDHYANKHNQVHIVENESKVSHISVDKEIMAKIKKEVKDAGYDPVSVNIFVNVKK